MSDERVDVFRASGMMEYKELHLVIGTLRKARRVVEVRAEGNCTIVVMALMPKTVQKALAARKR